MPFLNDSGLRACWIVGRVPPHRLSATFIVKGTFRLRHEQPVEVLSADDQEDPTGDTYRDDDPSRALLYPSDFALVKPRADATLVGTCHAPGGRPVFASAATVSIGAWSKTLRVVGDRIRRPGVGAHAPDPQPFVQMDMSWERALGGPKESANPVGRGIEEEPGPGGATVIRMPNIEEMERAVHAVQEPRPACFAPVPLTWVERMSKAGTFDERWLKERWPWFPRDVDWSIFNAAPRDQQFEFFRGDEEVRLSNLHPSHAALATQLPGLRPRFFVRRHGQPHPQFLEIPLHLDTLHLDADRERLYLVWRGVSEIRSKRMQEFLDYYVVSERLDAEPRPLAWYESAFDRRTAIPVTRRPAKAPLIESSRPQSPSQEWVAAVEADEARIKADVAAFEAETEARYKEIGDIVTSHGGRLPALPAPDPVPPVTPSAQDLLAIAMEQHALLQRFAPDVAAKLGPPQLSEFEPPVIEVPEPDLTGVPDAPPARRWTREMVELHARSGGSFAGETLSSLDLSGLDLHGLDFRGAILKATRLANCNLAGASFREASLPRADLHEANLSGADLNQADLMMANLANADLRDASMVAAELSAAQMVGVHLEGATADTAIFRGANLRDAVMQGGVFAGADFDSGVLDGADLTNAVLQQASFEEARAVGVRASGARLTGARAAHANFSGSVMNSIDAEGSVWEEANLERVDFTGASLRFANFTGASLRRARLIRTDLRHARLPDAVLEQASVVQANFFRGTVEGAVLAGADFRGANLFEVEFYEAELSGTAFAGANLKGSKLDGQA